MATGKTIALTTQTFVGKVMSLLFNMLSRFVITFLPRSKHLLISWLQSPSAVLYIIYLCVNTLKYVYILVYVYAYTHKHISARRKYLIVETRMKRLHL